VGKLAMRAVGLAPRLEQPHDLGDLPVQQAMQRAATRGLVGQLASDAPAQPPVAAQLADLQYLADGPHPPALLQGLLEQVQQPSLGGRVHPRWDLATQSQRPFPSTSTSLTASSLSASPSRAASARAASSSRSRLAVNRSGVGRDPGGWFQAVVVASSRG
jgi:hypothetical protein